MTREDAREAIKEAYGNSEYTDEIINALEQDPRWIPVSEGLPKKTGWYLITFKTYNGDDAVSEMCYRKPENYWTDKNICKKLIDNNEVTAWMPKPKAYKAESEEQDEQVGRFGLVI